MKWTVVWKSDALNDLSELWIESLDREGSTASSHLIDQILKMSPLTAGESREDNRRVLIVPPLAVTYQVSTDDFMVIVGAAWQSHRYN